MIKYAGDKVYLQAVTLRHWYLVWYQKQCKFTRPKNSGQPSKDSGKDSDHSLPSISVESI